MYKLNKRIKSRKPDLCNKIINGIMLQKDIKNSINLKIENE